MCNHVRQEYATSECWNCKQDQDFSDKVDALLRKVYEAIENDGWCGDDVRAHLKQAVKEFKS